MDTSSYKPSVLSYEICLVRSRSARERIDRHTPESKGPCKIGRGFLLMWNSTTTIPATGSMERVILATVMSFVTL